MTATIIGIQSTRMSQVQPERVSWLWPGRIPLGKLTILDGDPSNGKSTLTLDVAARLTRGDAMPDGTRPYLEGPADAIILTAEDGLGDTIRPRLDAAGADVDRVTAITGTLGDDGYEHGLTLPDDTEWVRSLIEATGARLVVIDPLFSFVGGDNNTHRDQDIRRALTPMARVAEDTGASVLVVRHLNKAGGGNPLYRGGGTIGIIALARSGLLVAPDPDDENRRVLASTKSNLAEKPPALAYRLEPASNGSVRIVWDGATDHTAGQLLAGPRDDEERTVRDEAKDILRDLLQDGPMPVEDVKRAMNRAGVSERQWRNAKRDLGVTSRPTGNPKHGGHYVWQLPDLWLNTQGDQPESDQPEKPYTHGQNGHFQAPVDHLYESEQPENSEAMNNTLATVRALRDSGYFTGMEPVDVSSGERVTDPESTVNSLLLQSELPGQVGIAAVNRLRKLLNAIEQGGGGTG